MELDVSVKRKEEQVSRDYDKLKNLILKKFGTFSNFAEISGYSSAAISQKLSGKIKFNLDDIDKWSAVIGIKKKDYGKYFF